ncbi:DUF1385 domain-containing protein [Desulfovibrio litoralis]
MEGIMLRHGSRLALAVRKPNGEIISKVIPWYSLTSSPLLKKPFLRGFPTLVETLINGIRALNMSATVAVEDDAQELTPWHLALTLIISIGMALLLFVVIPHVLTIGINNAGLSSGVENLSFHIWDGLFKMSMFVGYIAAISFVPDIRRVFQFHGAEHKIINAYETGANVTAASAANFSRLHPRCGTTFLLFVISISILLHVIFVPSLMHFWTPENAILKHSVIILVKLILIVPISSCAYELIRFAAKMNNSLLTKILQAPGLLLQKMTTKEPDQSQLEVAVVALYEVLGPIPPNFVTPPAYSNWE